MALTPPLAWSSWYALTTGLSCESAANQLAESSVLQIADALLATGLGAQGFRTVVLDDCWQNRSRDAEGNLHADVRAFPSGMGWLAAQLRDRGLGLGLYTTPGEFSCMKRPASAGHERQDVKLWVEEWGARYFKYCVCNTTHARREVAYGAMQEIIAATRLPVIYEIDPAMELPMTTMDGVGHIVGAHDDVADSYAAWVKAIRDLQSWGVYSGNHTRAGHWPLIDIVQTGRGGQTREEYRAQLSMYAMLCSPLILGVDLRNRTWAAAALPLLSNAEVWSVHQDPLGRHAVRVADGAVEVWSRPLQGGGFAVALWNVLGPGPADATLDLARATGAAGPWELRDLWLQRDLGRRDRFWQAVGLPPHSATLLRLSPVPQPLFF